MKRFFRQRNHSAFFDILNSDETLRIHSAKEILTQQHIKNSLSGIKKNYLQNWLKARNSKSDSSREKFPHKEIKKDYQ